MGEDGKTEKKNGNECVTAMHEEMKLARSLLSKRDLEGAEDDCKRNSFHVQSLM